MKCRNCGKKTTAPYCSKACLIKVEPNFYDKEELEWLAEQKKREQRYAAVFWR